MKEKFERNNNLVYAVMLIAFVTILSIIIITLFTCMNTVGIVAIVTCAAMSFVLLAAILIKMPRAFNYTVDVSQEERYIVITMSENEHRSLDIPFTVDKKQKLFGHTTLLLDDGFEKVEIQYNSRLLKFLKELQE